MEENNIVKFESDEGKTFEMLILKEFPYKKKKYAVLMDKNNCSDECDCGCNEGHDCNCSDECDCGCNEGHDCNCNDDCECGCNEPGLYILEISTDKDGNEIFKEIENEKLFDEVITEADKVLYEI